MKKQRPLPVIAPTAFVRVRPREVRACGRTQVGKGRSCAASRRLPRL
jgi:hypothetical protein